MQNTSLSVTSDLFLRLRFTKSRWELLVNLPFIRRRDALERFFTVPKDPVWPSPLLQAPSGEALEAVRKLGSEGVVGKRIDSIYEPGERSGAWIKLRTNMEQEFIIGGYIPGARGFDALLLVSRSTPTRWSCPSARFFAHEDGMRGVTKDEEALVAEHMKLAVRIADSSGPLAIRTTSGRSSFIALTRAVRTYDPQKGSLVPMPSASLICLKMGDC